MKTNLVVIAGGIGDALLWVPALKQMAHPPDVLYIYGAPKVYLIQENGLSRQTYVAESKSQLLRWTLRNIKRYEKVYLNHLCGGEYLFQMASWLGNEIVTNSLQYQQKKCKHLAPQKDIHDAVQNLLLSGRGHTQLKESDFRLTQKGSSVVNTKQKYICVHLCAGSNQTPYKNWPIRHWKNFISLLLPQYSDHDIVLLGGKEESELGKEIATMDARIVNMIGSTNLDEAFAWISGAVCFIGPDGGLMHMAICAGTPTFTIWGGSSITHYAYKSMAVGMHEVITRNLPCAPCNQWLQPNHTRVNDPLRCPDFACIRDLSSETVFKAFGEFYIRLTSKNP